jgi:predicted CoA-substrate-specific enzyme activase
MVAAGIDIGSRTIKSVLMDGNSIIYYSITDTGIDPLSNVLKILKHQRHDHIVATGYGRYLAQMHLQCPIITEIKAYAIGANFLFPECRTVLDIGGQDSKIIRVKDGKVEDFEMNDKCAAGTGKFLEVMATTLGFTLDEFSSISSLAEKAVPISSMCTVFAESEIVSLISSGADRKNIALGLHQSILNRIIALMGRIGFEEPIVFAGGVAKNGCMVSLLKDKLRMKVQSPAEPQIVGAIGSALVARQEMTRNQTNSKAPKIERSVT